MSRNITMIDGIHGSFRAFLRDFLGCVWLWKWISMDFHVVVPRPHLRKLGWLSLVAIKGVHIDRWFIPLKELRFIDEFISLEMMTYCGWTVKSCTSFSNAAFWTVVCASHSMILLGLSTIPNCWCRSSSTVVGPKKKINGHFRNLNWRYLPYIRPM